MPLIPGFAVGRSVRMAFTAAAMALIAPMAALHAAEVTLRIPGVTADVTDTARNASLSRAAVDEGRTEPQDLVAAAQADYRRVLAALYEKGYFSAAVNVRVDGREAANLSALRPPRQVDRIEIDVTPGPRFRFSQAEVTPLPAGTPPYDGFAPGDTAGTAIMREAANAGTEAWQQAGHAKAKVTQQDITVDHARESVAARFGITPGPRLTFGRARLSASSADSKVRPKRILAIAGIPEGEVYDPDDIDTAEQRLRRTGTFRSAVVAEDEAIGPGNTLGTEISVEDSKPRRVGVGIEVSTVEGLRLSGFWLHRNAFGGAERLRFDAEVSGIGGQTGGIDYSLGMTLTRPAFRHPDAQLTFAVLAEHEDEPSYVSDNIEATVGVDRIVNEHLTLTSAVGLRYSYTDDAFGTRDFTHIILSGGLIWENRDSTTDPRKGAYAEAEIKPFIGVASSKTGVRTTAELRGYRELGERLVLAGRVQTGSVFGPSIADTPPSFLFYSGGGGTVRGQGYQSLGVGSGASKTGGRSYAVFSTEMRFDVTDSIGAVAFVDYGYVASDSLYENGNWHGGAGLGVRYKTGLGPIRADLAVPITGKIDSVSLYVGIGQAF
ncbi:autotransporter assembly complex protein TamA [Pseudooceanicola sp. C21-150M6]|uniref:autotransporter assembly complex protein TamA n=1 Tax=Pseudooceanicola sp. C21-150M6 TaxID=3434355 RepID=UPI003D7F84A6